MTTDALQTWTRGRSRVVVAGWAWLAVASWCASDPMLGGLFGPCLLLVAGLVVGLTWAWQSLLWLGNLRRGLWYAVPLRRKGSGANGRNAWFAAPVGTVAWRAWNAEATRRRVRTRTVVRVRPNDGRVPVLAFAGWGAGRARAAVRRRAAAAGRKYRDRFGIETSYRQLNPGKGRTTAADVGYRLLPVGLGLLLRQVWVWLTAQLVRPRDRGAGTWVGVLPLATMAGWLADDLRRKYPEDRAILRTRPLPEIGG